MQGRRQARSRTAAKTRPLYVDALSALYPPLGDGYPKSDRPVSSKIAYVLYLFTWPMLLLSLAGLWGEAPLLATGTVAALLIIMLQARRLAANPRPRSASLLALVALSGLVSTIVALREGLDPAVAGRAELVIIIVIGLSAVLLSDSDQPSRSKPAWPSWPEPCSCGSFTRPSKTDRSATHRSSSCRRSASWSST